MPPFRPVRTNPLLALLVPLIASSSPAVPNDSFPPIAAQHSALELDLRFDSQGRPLLAWIEGVSVSDQQLFVQRRDPSGWVRLGGALNVDPGTAAQGAFVRPRFDGAVWAAWSENGGHADIVQFKVWDGLRWVWHQNMRQSIDLTYAARSRDLELERDGTPLWVWAEVTQTGIAVQTRRWTGATWIKSAALSLDPRTIATQPALVVNARGDRVMVWLEGDVARSSVQVKRWNGQVWQSLGGALNVRPQSFTFAPTVQLDPLGNPVVAWLEDRAGVDTLFVKRWNGTSWKALGEALNVDSAQFADRPSLTLHGDQPCVAWAEGGEARKTGYVKCFEGQSWRQQGKVLNTQPSSDVRGPILASSGNTLTVVWRERGAVGQPYRIALRQF